jgi:SOS response regulatory protein OraA/RecX
VNEDSNRRHEMNEQAKRLVKALANGIISEEECREALAKLEMSQAEIEAAVNG